MGRIRGSGSPVVRAKTKTTTDRRVRATSDCSTRNRTNRSTELINVGGSDRQGRSTEGGYAPLVLPRPASPTGIRSSAGPTSGGATAGVDQPKGATPPSCPPVPHLHPNLELPRA